MLVSNCGYGSKLSQRTCGVISSKSHFFCKSKHLIDLIPSLIPSQVWCLSKLTKLSDAEKRSHPEFSWTTPQKNGMEPQRWTPGTLEALQNWVNEVYVMVTWYQLFPSCFPLDLHIRYISHDKTSPKCSWKACDSKGTCRRCTTLHHVPDVPRSWFLGLQFYLIGRSNCVSCITEALEKQPQSWRVSQWVGDFAALDGKVKIFCGNPDFHGFFHWVFGILPKGHHDETNWGWRRTKWHWLWEVETPKPSSRWKHKLGHLVSS